MKAFFNTKSIVGRVLIVSLLAGGLVFAGAFAVNIFVPTPTDAASCCGSVDQVTTSDDSSSETGRCCPEMADPLTTSSSCSCGHSNCPDGSCSCGGSSKSCNSSCGTCSCTTTVCASGNIFCTTQGGTCTKNP